MVLTQYFILILCFAGVLSNFTNISNGGENKTQPFIEIGSKYYLINTVDTMNWFSAMIYCRNYDSHLAVIESEAEMNALNFYLITNEGHIDKNFWLGANDLVDEGKFMSVKDGRTMPYAKWLEGQPRDYDRNEDCLQLWHVNNIFYMNDENCWAKLYAICELPQPK